MNCDYCGESNDHVILVPKPKYILWNDTILNNVSVYRNEDLICLACLQYELEQITWS